MGTVKVVKEWYNLKTLSRFLVFLLSLADLCFLGLSGLYFILVYLRMQPR